MTQGIQAYYKCMNLLFHSGQSSSSSSFTYTVATIASITAAVALIVVIVLAKVIMCYYKRRATRPRILSSAWFQRRTSEDSINFRPPPEYNVCANNLDTYPKPKKSEKKDDILPSYDLVHSENYVQITVPIDEEIQRMKETMASRQTKPMSYDNAAYQKDPEHCEVVGSTDAMATDVSNSLTNIPITGVPAVSGGSQLMAVFTTEDSTSQNNVPRGFHNAAYTLTDPGESPTGARSTFI